MRVFGPRPQVSLREARDRRDEAKRRLREHRDPNTEERKRKSVAHAAVEATFEVVAERWYAAQLNRL